MEDSDMELRFVTNTASLPKISHSSMCEKYYPILDADQAECVEPPLLDLLGNWP